MITVLELPSSFLTTFTGSLGYSPRSSMLLLLRIEQPEIRAVTVKNLVVLDTNDSSLFVINLRWTVMDM